MCGLSRTWSEALLSQQHVGWNGRRSARNRPALKADPKLRSVSPSAAAPRGPLCCGTGRSDHLWVYRLLLTLHLRPFAACHAAFMRALSRSLCARRRAAAAKKAKAKRSSSIEGREEASASDMPPQASEKPPTGRGRGGGRVRGTRANKTGASSDPSSTADVGTGDSACRPAAEGALSKSDRKPPTSDGKSTVIRQRKPKASRKPSSPTSTPTAEALQDTDRPAPTETGADTVSGIAAATQPVLSSVKPKARKPPGRREALAKVAPAAESSDDALDTGGAGAATHCAHLSTEPGEDQGIPLHASSSAGRHLAASQGASSEQCWTAPAEDAWCYIVSSPEPCGVQESPQPGSVPLSPQQQDPAVLTCRAGDASKAALRIRSTKKVSAAHLRGMPVLLQRILGTHRPQMSGSRLLCTLAVSLVGRLHSKPSLYLTAGHIPAGWPGGQRRAASHQLAQL